MLVSFWIPLSYLSGYVTPFKSNQLLFCFSFKKFNSSQTMPSTRNSSKKKRNNMEPGNSKTVLSTPECTCEASSSCLSGPSSSTCELHKTYPECELEFYEQMEQLRNKEFISMTNTHEKRMKYFRKELVEYLQDTSWKYKPIEHYINY